MGRGGSHSSERFLPSPIFLVPFLTAALDDHALEGAFAGAAGLHVRGVLQRHVHEAAMVGAHGPGGAGTPRGTDTFRQRKGQLTEPVVLTFAVGAHIELHAHRRFLRRLTMREVRY